MIRLNCEDNKRERGKESNKWDRRECEHMKERGVGERYLNG